MRIILMRHGKPNVPYFSPITAEDFKTWIYKYDHVGLCDNTHPSPEAVTLAANCNFVVCSNLVRSTETAKRLGVKEIHRVYASFREMQIPGYSFPVIKLLPKIWSAIYRGLWFCGFSKNTESFSKAKVRAEYAAIELEKVAKRNGSVIFVGHRFLNKYIAKHLLSNGWDGPTNPSPRFWSYGIFEYKTHSR